ncbi:1-phosphofructokinase [Sporolactobacillus shoreicorticis]|uniref:Tagatose-6-phosphate kinase n=1 Tax=Sporolactobacillus shoreicorticis TaxID=1923877 RepID=A0ABW5RZH2_9BACL|nr:1-phosphofructokinase [Sporolactobacillus shoreicorticis]MCO7128088.1 1-phosphofructokinase [Sporolactobacillus shoreicorticis]
MIYTCTMNPAIDLFTEFDSFEPHVVNRSIFEDYQANGKTINISFMLKKMGIDSVATGFLGGFTGMYINDELKRTGIATDFVMISGITRINTFIKAGAKEYKAVNRGPEISSAAQAQLIDKISKLTFNDLLFVSGSLPRGVDDSILKKISRLSAKNGFKLILDVSAKGLLDCLEDRPYLIKPSDEELAAWLAVDPESFNNEANLMEAAETLLKKGAQRILVSRGEKGTMYADGEKVLFTTAPRGEVVNTACAGDTLLGTFVGSLISNKSLEDALVYATAAGSSTAFTAGLSDLKDVPELMKQIKLTTHMKGAKES